MARGRPWTEEEDAAIARATFENLELGILAFRPYARSKEKGDFAGRLERLAGELGRTYAAVRKRASRIGAASYRARSEDSR